MTTQATSSCHWFCCNFFSCFKD